MLIALDCDGTIAPSGPISHEDLAMLVRAGHMLCLVSQSTNCDGLPYPKFRGMGEQLSLMGRLRQRTSALEQALNRFPSEERLYVSDDPGDDRIAELAGFDFLHPEHFSLERFG